LRDARHALDVVVARDPDDAGPAEAELTSPARLIESPDIVAAINANAFAHVSPPRTGPIGTWRAGRSREHQRLGHASVSPGQSPAANESPWSFWLTVDGRARVSPLEPQGAARLAVAGFASLMVDGRITAELGGPLHPRTAIGVDLHRASGGDGRRGRSTAGLQRRNVPRLNSRSSCGPWAAMTP
jgi:hypothetical protein